MVLAPKRYELDLSKYALNIYFGQGAVEISEVKVGGRKKNLPVQPTQGTSVSNLAESGYFFPIPTLIFDIFEALEPKSKLSTSFETSI